MENVGNNKQEYVIPYQLNAGLQTTEEPSWETKKNSLQTIISYGFQVSHPQLIFTSIWSILFSAPLSFVVFPYNPNHTETLSLYLLGVTLKFLLLSLYAQPVHLYLLCTQTHTCTNYKVPCFCYGSSCAHIWLVEPDTENNEQLGMTNSVCRIPLYQLSLDITVSFVYVCVYFSAASVDPHIQSMLY